MWVPGSVFFIAGCPFYCGESLKQKPKPTRNLVWKVFDTGLFTCATWIVGLLPRGEDPIACASDVPIDFSHVTLDRSLNGPEL